MPFILNLIFKIYYKEKNRKDKDTKSDNKDTKSDNTRIQNLTNEDTKSDSDNKDTNTWHVALNIVFYNKDTST